MTATTQRKSTAQEPQDIASPDSRRVPKQERSRQRVEAILDAAMQLIGEKGVDAVTMLEIARKTGGPLASIYQYFPNKSAILAMLFERWCEMTRQDVADAATHQIETLDEFVALFSGSLDLYAERVRADPAIQDLINAVLADKTLQHMDIEDSRWHAGAIIEAARPLVPEGKRAEFERTVFLLAHLIGGLMRLVLAVGKTEGDKLLEDYKLLCKSSLQQILR